MWKLIEATVNARIVVNSVDVNRHEETRSTLRRRTKQTRQKKISKIKKSFGGGTREEKWKERERERETRRKGGWGEEDEEVEEEEKAEDEEKEEEVEEGRKISKGCRVHAENALYMRSKRARDASTREHVGQCLSPHSRQVSSRTTNFSPVVP